ncbi:MAG TPA: hypothetical protein VHI54_00725 [Actinomycetota bacterium]|nr:hypothetical protein [Actinomycetota bacterium]
MADTRAPGSQDDTTRGTRERPHTPRWVIVSLVIVGVLAVAFIVTRLAGVQHGPGLHTPNDGGPTPSVAHPALVDHGP